MKFAPDEARAPSCVSREEIENEGDRDVAESGVARDWSVGNAVKLVSRRDSSPNFVGKRWETMRRIVGVGWVRVESEDFYYIRCILELN